MINTYPYDFVPYLHNLMHSKFEGSIHKSLGTLGLTLSNNGLNVMKELDALLCVCGFRNNQGLRNYDRVGYRGLVLSHVKPHSKNV